MTTNTNTRPLSSVERVAVSTPTETLRHALNTLNSDVEQAISLGVRGTQAHAGMLEMIHVFSRELALRQVAA